MQVCPECGREYEDEVEYCPHDAAQVREVQHDGSEDERDSLVGRLLDGRWRIQEKFGEGGMGSIYIASQESVGREVVIKTLRTGLSDSEEFTDRFWREAKVTTTINHPHCVTILDYGETEDGTLYLAMEFLDGEPLADRMERGHIPLVEILEIGKQIASALAAAHQREIVHRDLKPDNIYLLDISDGSTFVKVLDFGISKDLSSEDNLTQTGQLFGTPQYMSPEQSQDGELDGRTDLYSLGCILYELLAEQPPFTGDSPTSILLAHVQRDVSPLGEVASREIPSRLEDLVVRLLAKDPEDRPQTATEVRQILGDILADQSTAGSHGAETSAETEAADQQEEVGRAATLGAGASEERVESDGGSPKRASSDDAPTPTAGAAQEVTRENTSSSTLEANRGLLILAIGLLILACLGVGGLSLYYVLSEEKEAKAQPVATEQTDLGAESTTTSGASADVGRTPDVGRHEQPADAAADSDPDVGVDAGEEAARVGAKAEQRGDEQAQGSSGRSGGAHGSSESGEEHESGGDASTGDDSEAPSREESKEKVVEESSSGEKTSEASGLEESHEGPEVDEPGESEPNPASFVRRVSLSITGPVCSRGEIEGRIDERMGRLGACYRDETGGGGTGPSGNVLVEWNISTDGTVIEPAVLTSSLGHPTIESCVEQKLSNLEFPAPEGGRCYTRAKFAFGK
jgi:serine/threonine protein kinase